MESNCRIIVMNKREIVRLMNEVLNGRDVPVK